MTDASAVESGKAPAATAGLDADECGVLRGLVAMMIPASVEFDLPGADDARIFADILSIIGATEVAGVRQAVAALQSLSQGRFASLGGSARQAVVERFRQESGPLALLLMALTVRCYYRDDRVMQALGMEARPPFPRGFDVKPGDLSLLDAVRARPRIYRDAP